MNIGTYIILGYAIILLLLVIVGFVVLNNMSNMEEQFKFVVTHDALVISKAHLLFKLVIDMETGQRGFIITQKEEFLEPYYQGSDDFNRIITEEKLLVDDNPRQVARLERIEHLVEEWKTNAAIPEIAMARKVSKHNIDASYLQSVLGKGVGKGLMDKIRKVLSEMNDNFIREGNKDGQILAIAIEKDMVDMETGQRGFLVTGKESFLEPYRAGKKQLKIDFSELRNILSDDQTNLKLLDEALSISDDWIIKAATPEIDARIQMNKDPETMKDVSSLLEVGTGKNILDQLREEFAQFIQIEENLTISRHTNATEAASTTRTITIGVVLLSILIGIIVATLIRQRILLQVGGEPFEIALLSKQVASGDLDVHIGKSTGILKSIKIMLQSLKANRDHLQNLVDERTIELKEANKDLKIEMVNRIQVEKELIVAKEEAEEANEIKSQFLANMSHELRTPLNAIIGYSELLDEDFQKSGELQHSDDVKKINRSGKHLLSLINDILDISKIEAGKMDLYVESFTVKSLIDEVITTIKPLAEQNRNSLKFSIADKSVTIQNDRTKLRQILYNLLSNACKFTTDGKINLSANIKKNDDGEDYFFIEVTDSGIGMTKEQLEKIFKPFIQADSSTTRQYGGTGLGLVLTKQITDLLGGKISLISELGKGTTFTVTVPANISIEDEQVKETSSTEEDKVIEKDVVLTEGSNLILVIDDDLVIHDFLRRQLEKEGYSIISANNGKLGLEMAREYLPDIIILDVYMDDIEGWDVIRILKSDDALSDIPVIMLTISEDKQKGFDLGASDYLIKPIDNKTLVRALSKFKKGINTFSVLVVENDKDTRERYSMSLKKNNWKVYQTENGVKALKQVGKKIPDLILLDLMMPVMDGFEFVEKLHENEEWSSIPVVVITAKDLSKEDRIRLRGRILDIIQKNGKELEIIAKSISRKIKYIRPSENADKT